MGEKYADKAIEWLLEPDDAYPSIQYLTRKNILHEDGSDLRRFRDICAKTGIIPFILEKVHPDGYWESPDSIYLPKYTASIWQVILLAQMGLDNNSPQVKQAGEFLLNHVTEFGGFSINGRQSGCAYCLQGNACAALLELGFQDDVRLQRAINWMARSVTGIGFLEDKSAGAGNYYLRSGVSGPGFLCSANDQQPCAWGAVKVALALGKVDELNSSSIIAEAIDVSKKFLLNADPATADYPHPYAKKPSQSWFRFGFPVFYVTDVLQNLEALIGLGLSGDQRLESAIQLVENSRGYDDFWKMTYSYNGKMWVDIEEKGKPSKWVTYRAMKVLAEYFR